MCIRCNLPAEKKEIKNFHGIVFSDFKGITSPVSLYLIGIIKAEMFVHISKTRSSFYLFFLILYSIFLLFRVPLLSLRSRTSNNAIVEYVSSGRHCCCRLPCLVISLPRLTVRSLINYGSRELYVK